MPRFNSEWEIQFYASVAQVAERRTDNPEVASSSGAAGTKVLCYSDIARWRSLVSRKPHKLEIERSNRSCAPILAPGFLGVP
jgi:hypothetical protein